MENIERPKKVPKAQTSYLTNDKYQELVNEQLKRIYDKLDEIVSYINNH